MIRLEGEEGEEEVGEEGVVGEEERWGETTTTAMATAGKERWR